LAHNNLRTKTATPAFLSNLGRATLRGIRKCPQCGVYNGTRGLSCKNKACGVSLRNASSTGRSSVQVFSVCHRGRGVTGTQCGFVELVPTDTAIATGDGPTLLTRINLGRCFLPSCKQGQRSNQGESPAAKQSSESLCVHIKQAIECRSRATPLTFKSSVLEGLKASDQVKEELWRLATESPGPLVQRVSKDTLVVKCHTDSHHPLGLLHLTVGAGGPSSEALKSERSIFHCACQPPPSSFTLQPCLHFFACVCAFASDEKLASEFSAFLNYASSGTATQLISTSFERTWQQTGITLVLKCCQTRVLNPTKYLYVSGSTQAVDEHTVMMGFHQWLASVTERIHLAMHYQCDGKPEPLVYHIPQEFFNALQQRLSLGSKKRRLPNFTTAFVRNDGLPQTSYSKYTWHITNLMQVKRIFDTPELPLEVTQSFVKNADGSYSHFRCPEPPPELESLEGCKSDRPQAIRPMELRTFLKVGAADQKEACPFVIDWIPDVLPRCHVGELRISFEFGHQQSGQPEHGDKMSAAEKGGRNKSDCPQHKLTNTVEILQVVV
uniref:Chromosome 2 open reading frame 42 n=1 Tax=Neolamprologus brichardi TaxID=32507 RepID=A0A3Q4GX75_NEOBR